MADIEYIIGAKDHATAPINKVDGALAKLERSTKQVADASQKSLAKVEISFASLAKGAGVVAVAAAAVQALRSAVSSSLGSIGSANAAFDTQTEAVKGLEDSLRRSFDAMGAAVGESVDAMSASLQRAASDLQSLTGVGDEVTLG